jgi:hypothetical protein
MDGLVRECGSEKGLFLGGDDGYDCDLLPEGHGGYSGC